MTATSWDSLHVRDAVAANLIERAREAVGTG